ncbi:MAG: hypothetical protein ABI402_07425 [Ferruginibacter sp.]
MKKIIFLFITAILFYSCCHKVDCEKYSLKFVLISFTPEEMDTLIFRKFDANSNFTNPTDSMLTNSIDLFYNSTHGDSVALETYNSTNFKFQMQSGFDYEIFIPGAGRLIKINNIIENQTEVKHCDISDGNHGCTNPVPLYKVDGQAQTGEYFYIHR